MKVEIQAPYLSDRYSFFSGPVSQILGKKSPSVLHSVVLLSVIEKKENKSDTLSLMDYDKFLVCPARGTR